VDRERDDYLIWAKFLPPALSMFSFFFVRYIMENLWISLLLSCAVGIAASEMRRVIIDRYPPFSNIRTIAVIPIALIVLLSLVMGMHSYL
jgi:hypothetical protein